MDRKHFVIYLVIGFLIFVASGLLIFAFVFAFTDKRSCNLVEPNKSLIP